VPALVPYVIAPLYFPGNQGSLLASLLNEFSLYQEPPVFFALKTWPVTPSLYAAIFVQLTTIRDIRPKTKFQLKFISSKPLLRRGCARGTLLLFRRPGLLNVKTRPLRFTKETRPRHRIWRDEAPVIDNWFLSPRFQSHGAEVFTSQMRLIGMNRISLLWSQGGFRLSPSVAAADSRFY
jgi:hypothetical protein